MKKAQLLDIVNSCLLQAMIDIDNDRDVICEYDIVDVDAARFITYMILYSAMRKIENDELKPGTILDELYNG